MKLLSTLVLVSLVQWSSSASNRVVFAPTESSVEDAVAKWTLMEDKMKTSRDQMLKMVKPYLTQSDVELSEGCALDLLQFVLDLGDMKIWAEKMWDATGKPSGGILMGKFGFYGSLDECVDVVFPIEAGSESEATIGQYCTIGVTFPLPPKPDTLYVGTPIFGAEQGNWTLQTEVMQEFSRAAIGLYSTSIRFGVCLPSTCGQADINNVLESALESMELEGRVISCEQKSNNWNVDSVQWTIVAIFAAILLLNLCSALCDAILFPKDKLPETKAERLLVLFSPLRNLPKSLQTTDRPTQFSSLDGLKVISLSWVILCHSYLNIPLIMMDHLTKENEFRSNFLFQAIANGFLSVDSFFVISGTLLTYHVIKLNYFSIPFLLVKRIWRLLPSVALMIGLIIVLPLATSGPMWHEVMDKMADNCRARWWTNFIFISNYNTLNNACMVHGWFVSVDMQCFLLTVIYLAVFLKNRTAGKILLALFVLASIVSTGLVTYWNNFPPTYLISIADHAFQAKYFYMYSSTYIHVSSYAIGATLGTYLATTDTKLTKKTLVIGWSMAIVSAVAVTYGVYPYNSLIRIPTQLESITYAALHKVTWSMSVAWVILVCVKGYGGLVNEFLSWSAFRPMARLSYLVYLISNIVSQSHGASRSDTTTAQHSAFVWKFLGDLAVSFTLSIGISAIFETPCMELQRMAFERIRVVKNKSQVDDVTMDTFRYKTQREIESK